MTNVVPSFDDLPPAIVAILERRGIVGREAVERFLAPDYERDLHSPWLLGGMEAAVVRLCRAAEQGERVVIYGDYDIDGITATAVMLEGLAAAGIEADWYIPDRFEEGYGINRPALEHLQAQGAQLVISVDCGITSVAEAAWAREHGLDLIITDHHAVPPVVPEAVAVINPKLPEDQYPCKDLAGVGVAFKVVQALSERTGKPSAGQLKWLLDLVAYGTVCDVVKLTDENRALVYYGLKVLAKTRRPGLRALAEVAGVDLGKVRAHHLGFMLGPRMNAAGRLEHARKSVELVLAEDAETAGRLAAELDLLNHQRRADQERIYEAALVQAGHYSESGVLVVAAEDWSHGVVGIVASKLVERLGRPALVAQVLGEFTKGSARSVPGFHLVEALRAGADLFERFGGHAYAAGFTIRTERLDGLRAHLDEYWREHTPDPALAQTEADLVLSGVEQLDWSFYRAMELLEPFGNGNPEPRIVLKEVRVEQPAVMGTNGKHLRGRLVGGAGMRPLRMVAFGLGERVGELEQTGLQLLGYLQTNEYQGTTSLQFVVKEMSFE